MSVKLTELLGKTRSNIQKTQSEFGDMMSSQVNDAMNTITNNIAQTTKLLDQSKKYGDTAQQQEIQDDLYNDEMMIEQDSEYRTIANKLRGYINLNSDNSTSLQIMYYLMLNYIAIFMYKNIPTFDDSFEADTSSNNNNNCRPCPYELFHKNNVNAQNKKRIQDQVNELNDEINDILISSYSNNDKFNKIVHTLATTQAESLIQLAQSNYSARVAHASAMVTQVKTSVEHQQQSIDALKTMHVYVNEQVNDHATVYQRLQSLNATQQRKSAFHVNDLKELNRWSYWCRVVFWVLVVFFVLMVLVDQYRAVASFTANMDNRLKQVASAARQVVGAAGQ